MGTIKVAFDAGHGTDTWNKATQTGSKGIGDFAEFDFNSPTVAKAKAIAEPHGFEIILTQPLDGKDVPLTTRTNMAKQMGAKAFVSFHADAHNTPEAVGHQAFYWHTDTQAKRLAIAWAMYAEQYMKNPARGNNGITASVPGTWTEFHMCREPNKVGIPAILIEHAFFTTPKERELLKTDDFQRKCAISIVRALCDFFGIAYLGDDYPYGKIIYEGYPEGTIGVVTADLLNIRDYPNSEASKVIAKAPKGTKIAVLKSDMEWTQVRLDNGALAWVWKDFLNISKPVPAPIPVPRPVPSNPIMGNSTCAAEQMAKFIQEVNPNFDIEIAKVFLAIGSKYGVRGDVALCQSIIETGWFKFDGGTAVTPDQHNCCGMGVTQKGMRGESFATIADGVTAQIQHLFAYACDLPLPVGETILDPRFNLVKRGVAPGWEDLSNRWAMNANYGKDILAMYAEMLKFVPKPQNLTWQQQSGLDAVAYLHSTGDIKDSTTWTAEKMNEPAPVWLVMTLLARAMGNK